MAVEFVRRVPKRAAALTWSFCLALSLLGPHVSAAARPAQVSKSPRPVELGGVNEFRANASATARVVIPRPAWVAGPANTPTESTEGSNPDVSVTGKSAVAGFYLRKESGQRHPPDLLFVNVAECSGERCRAGSTVIYSMFDHNMGDSNKRSEIPPGTYRLYLITDGSPVAVSLRLHGLHGHSYVNPTQPAKVSFEEPTVHVSEDNTGAVYSTGDTQELRGDGFLYSALILEGENWGGGQYGDCLFKGDPPAPEEVAYQFCPPPPLSEGGWEEDNPDPLAGPYLEGMETILYLRPDRWSYGMWYRVASRVETLTSHVFWLTYAK